MIYKFISLPRIYILYKSISPLRLSQICMSKNMSSCITAGFTHFKSIHWNRCHSISITIHKSFISCQLKIIGNDTPLITVILISWGIALIEYLFMIPANRYGFHENGGTFSLAQLKVMQEAITLVVFAVFTIFFFKGETLHWNHLAAFGCLVAAVYFVFLKP